VELVIFIGLQASGKSTFYRERFFRTHLRINLDMLKTRHREWRLFQTCLEVGQRVVIDNTNPARLDRARYITPARTAGFSVTGYFFRSRLSESLARNALREGEERIPDAGLRRARARLERPSGDEGFDALYHVSLLAPSGFSVREWVE